MLLGLLALFAWLAVLRPLMRRHLAVPPPTPPVAAVATVTPDTPPAEPEETLQQRESTRQKADMDYAQQTADKDPKLVAALIQHWMHTND